MTMTSLKNAILLMWLIGIVHGEEPKCTSRFDYDEQMLMKLLRLEDQVNKFQEFSDDMKARESEEIVNRQKLMQEAIDEFKVRTNTSIKELKDNTIQIQTEIARIQNIDPFEKDPVIAFTVTTPEDHDNVLRFTSVVTNEGGNYDVNTGKFRCRVPGLYFFILHLTKKRDTSNRIDLTGTEIRKNDAKIVKAYIDPADAHADLGSYGASTSVYVMLDVNDVIHAHKTYSASTMESFTTFSGTMITGK